MTVYMTDGRTAWQIPKGLASAYQLGLYLPPDGWAIEVIDDNDRKWREEMPGKLKTRPKPRTKVRV